MTATLEKINRIYAQEDGNKLIKIGFRIHALIVFVHVFSSCIDGAQPSQSAYTICFLSIYFLYGSPAGENPEIIQGSLPFRD